MTAGEVSVWIDRSPSEVFAVVSDAEQTPRWSSSAIESRVTTPGPVGVGSIAHEVSRFLGRRFEVESEIVAFEPDRLLGVLVTGGPFPLRASFRLETVDDGCQVRAIFHAQPAGLLRVVEVPLRIAIRRKFAADLANLKRELEHDRA
jgi:hypothetical protein